MPCGGRIRHSLTKKGRPIGPHLTDPALQAILWNGCDRASEQFPIGTKERMWSVELADRHLMGHEVAEALARKPSVEVEGRRLDLEGWFSQFCEVQVDGVIGRRADRAGPACK